MAQLIHPLPPIWDENARVLILGSFPSPQSRRQGIYYGPPQNRFWRVLSILFDQPLPQTPDEKRAFALAHGIALWDVLHACQITGASDASIRDPVPNDLLPLLQNTHLRAIYTTGSTAAKLYRKLQLPITGIPAVALPSTSPANCRTSLQQLVEAYRVLLADCL